MGSQCFRGVPQVADAGRFQHMDTWTPRLHSCSKSSKCSAGRAWFSCTHSGTACCENFQVDTGTVSHHSQAPDKSHTTPTTTTSGIVTRRDSAASCVQGRHRSLPLPAFKVRHAARRWPMPWKVVPHSTPELSQATTSSAPA